MAKVTDDQLRQWEEQVAAWKESGLSQAKWCKSNGIGETTFRYRRTRLEDLAAGRECKEEKSLEPRKKKEEKVPEPKGENENIPVKIIPIKDEDNSCEAKDAKSPSIEINIESIQIKISGVPTSKCLDNIWEVLKYAK